MTPGLPLVRRSLSWRRRLAALVLLVTQVGVATSLVFEAQAETRLSAHAEQDGARHAGLHNESTCVVCAVRSMHAATPQHAAPATVGQVLARPAALTLVTAPQRDGPGSNPSRAPPPLRA